MAKSISICMMILLGLSTVLTAGEKKVWKKGDQWPYPPLKLVDVVVRSSVAVQGGHYTYHYAVGNSARNVFAIWSLMVDLRDYPQHHQLLQSDLTATHDGHEHFMMITSTPMVKLLEKINPVGWEFEKASKIEGVDGHWVAEQGGAVGNTTINPGNSSGGFAMRASEPPGIREFVVDADLSLLDKKYPLPCKTAAECDFYDYSEEFIIECNKGIQYLGKTVAPVKPPEPFTVSSWTVRMTADAVEARKLKWIKTDKNLLEIKKLIATLNTEDRSALAAAVKKIENYVLAEKKRGNLADEADALIRLNAQYLLRRLEGAGVGK